MTNDEEFFNIDASSVKGVTPRLTEKKEEGDTPISPTSFNKGIIERTIHTIHTVWVYPNGEIYIKKPISWLDKKGTIIKTKEKKKPIQAEKAVLQNKEEY